MRVAVLSMLLTAVCAAAPTTQPLPDRVQSVIQRLDADTGPERQAAALELGQLPRQALPLLEAALKRPGLSPEARNALELAMPQLRRVARLAEHREAKLAYQRRTLGEAYDKSAKKDPRWDAAARRALEAVAVYWTDSDHLPWSVEQEATEALLAARAAECDDPMVAYAALRILPSDSKQLIPAAEALAASGYPANRKYSALYNAAAGILKRPRLTDTDKSEALRLSTAALEQVAPMLQDGSRPDDATMTGWMNQLVDALKQCGRDRHECWQAVDAQLAKALPNDDVVRLNVEGDMYVSWAWDARGGGWARTVTPDGWQLFGERLNRAEEVLARAHRLHPHFPFAAARMITVEMGQGQGRRRMEQWFKRAVEADPHNLDAYYAKLLYLDPKWHGSVAERTSFGRECLASGYFESQVPLVVHEAHERAETGRVWGDCIDSRHFAQEAVWADLSAAFEGYLQLNPDVTAVRSHYAYAAWRAGKYKVAHAQLTDLGDRVDLHYFKHREVADIVRSETLIRQDPRFAEPVPASAAMDQRRQRAKSLREQLRSAYQAAGRRDQRWDAAALNVLSAAAADWARDPDRDFAERDRMITEAQAAIDAGCDDPLIRFVRSNTIELHVAAKGPDFKAQGYRDAVDLLDSGYPAYLRQLGIARATWLFVRNETHDGDGWKADCLKNVHSAMALLGEAIRAGAGDPVAMRDDANELVRLAIDLGEDGLAARQRIAPAMAEARLDPVLVQEFEVTFKLHYAWPAYPDLKRPRDSFKPEELAPWRARMADAQAAAIALWKQRPDRPLAPRLMLTIAKSQPVDALWLDFWFLQANSADPTDTRAARTYLDGLQATNRSGRIAWLGEFAGATGDIRNEIPFLQVDATVYATRINPEYTRIAPKPDEARLAEPERWEVLSDVYRRHLAAYPGDSDRRSEYARYAALAGKWDVAAAELKRLGDRARPRVFGSVDELERLRGRALAGQ